MNENTNSQLEGVTQTYARINDLNSINQNPLFERLKNVANERMTLKSMSLANDYSLLWLDLNMIEESDNWKEQVDKLKTLIPTIHLFTSIDDLFDEIRYTTTKQRILVTTAYLATAVVPRLTERMLIQSIYVLCGERIKYKFLENLKPKITQIANNFDSLYRLLQKKLVDSEANLLAFAIEPTTDSDSLDPTYMYITLFKEIILNTEYDKNDFLKMIEHFENKCKLPPSEMLVLEEFKEEYGAHMAIWWYTRPCFLHEYLNRSLYTFNVEAIIAMAPFIKDLDNQITGLHRDQGMSTFEKRILYRGHLANTEQLKTLKQSVGGLIAFNNFLSTSKSLNIAENFLSNSDPEMMVKLLFIVKIDDASSNISYADVSQFGFFGHFESEILFSCNTVFRITSILDQNDDTTYSTIYLEVTDRRDERLEELSKTIDPESADQTPKQRLASLLLHTGHNKLAVDIYRQLLEVTSQNEEYQLAYLQHQLANALTNAGKYADAREYYENSKQIFERILPSTHQNLATSNACLGRIHSEMGDFSEALKYYSKSHQIYRTSLHETHASVGTSFACIGRVYSSMGLHTVALECYHESHRIFETSLPATHPSIAASFNNIGLAYFWMGEYANALENYNKSHQIYAQSLPATHPSLATNFNNIGLVYSSMGDYHQALENYKKALVIYKDSLSWAHPDVGASFSNIGLVYSSMGEYANALESLNRAHRIFKESLHKTHPNLATSYNNIGLVYSLTGDNTKALECYEKANEIYKQSLPATHPDLATSFSNIGRVHSDMGDYMKALEFYIKSLKIQEEILPATHPSLATSFACIGGVYSDIGDYAKALEFYLKSLKIREASLPATHPNLANSFACIGGVYSDMGDYAKALEFYLKSLKIREVSLPATHPNLATSFACIGGVYSDMGDYTKALEYYERDLRITQESLPATHPNIAYSLENIGRVYVELGEFETATIHHQKGLEIIKKAFGDVHPSSAISYRSLGNVKRLLGHFDEAKDLLTKAREIQESIVCAPISYSRTINYLGELARDTGVFDESLNLHQKAWGILEEKLSENHPELAECQFYLAQVLKCMNRRAEAVESARCAVQIASVKLSKNHPKSLKYKKLLEDLELDWK